MNKSTEWMRLAMFRKFKKIRVAAGCFMAALVVFCFFYIRARPLMFNESSFMHAHCIVIMGLSMDSYAAEHHGHYPMDTNGYGNALLQLTNYTSDFWAGMTGPGYDGKVFEEAARTGRRIPEAKCGRIYVQGLSRTDNPDIALFFDKIPSPGGDHCHALPALCAVRAGSVDDWRQSSFHSRPRLVGLFQNAD